MMMAMTMSLSGRGNGRTLLSFQGGYDTGFWVDHTERLETLAWAKDIVNWLLGELHDGHEFLLVLEVRPRTRSTSQSTSRPEALS